MDQKKSPNRRSKRQTKVAEDCFWDCSVCTYRNTAEAFKCLMCDVRKGTSTRKPRINPQLVAQQVAQQYTQPAPKVKRDGPGSKADPGSPGGSTVGDGRSLDSADVVMGELSGGDSESRPSSKSEKRASAVLSPANFDKAVPPAVVTATLGLVGAPITPKIPFSGKGSTATTTTPTDVTPSKKGTDTVRSAAATGGGTKTDNSKVAKVNASGGTKVGGSGSKVAAASAKISGSGSKGAGGNAKVAGATAKIVGAAGGRVTANEPSRNVQVSPGAAAKGAGGGSAGRGAGAVALGFAGGAAAPVAGGGVGLGIATASDFPVAAMDVGSVRGIAGVGGASTVAASSVNVGGAAGGGGTAGLPPTINHFPPPPSLRAEKKNGNNTMHSDGKPSRKARRLTYPSRPKLKNVDRSSAQHNSVTVNNVTVIITEFQPKRHQSSSADHHLGHNHHAGHSSPAAPATVAAAGARGQHAASNNNGHHRNGAAAGQQNGNHSDSTNLSTDSHSDGRSS